MKASTAERLAYICLILTIGVAALGILFLLFAVPSLVLMIGWNLAMPALFGLPAIGFWPAFGAFLILFVVGARLSGASEKRTLIAQLQRLSDLAHQK